MDILKQIHDLGLPNPFPFVSPFNTPLALVSFVLFLWSFGPALKGEVRPGFLVWLRLTWAALLIPAATGVMLALGGGKVASSVPAGAAHLSAACQEFAAKNGLDTSQLTRYCLPADPVRDGEHLMYSAFALLSLYAIEVLIKGRLVDAKKGLRVLPVVTLFLYGAVYMIGRVAVFPGNR